MAMMIWRKLLGFALTVLVASVLIFVLMRLAGGDAVTMLFGEDYDPAAAEALRAKYGLDRPLPVQYFDWMLRFLSGDLGVSLRSGASITDTLGRSLTVTLPLAALGLSLGILLGVTAGVIAAKAAGTPTGATVSALSQLGLAVPNFWLGIMLGIVFGVYLGWLPTGGWVPWHVDPLGSLKALILPTIALGTSLAASLTRYVRTTIMDVMREDYVRTARATGMTEQQALFRVGLRNASLPVVTLLGLQAAGLIGGTVVVETVFSLPGVGRMMLTGVGWRDSIIVQSLALLLVIVVIGMNLLIDVLYGVLDPRVRRAR